MLDDANTFSLESQWMVGDSLLVRPVTDANAVTAEVYFPSGTVWYDLNSLISVVGSASFRSVEAPLSNIPVFIKGGKIIPRKMRLRRSSKLMFYDPYTLVIALDGNGYAEGSLYLDDEHTLAHESSNAYALRQFVYTANKLSCSTAKTMQKGSELFSAQNTVERIVIAGLTKPPLKVLLTTAGGSNPTTTATELTSFFDPQSKILTIKKPDALVISDWEISLQF
jgi:alpha 1,3-glucosidase